MVKQISTGVIGTGSMGQHHVRIWAMLPGSQFVGIADANKERAQEIASRYNVSAYADYHDLLPHMDAVSIAAPTCLHHEIGLACLAQGVHVLMETPLATSLAEAQVLVNSAQEAGLVLQVDHIERFNPTFVELTNVREGVNRKSVAQMLYE